MFCVVLNKYEGILSLRHIIYDIKDSETLEEVKEYFEENGMDVDEMSMNELEEASEVFALPNGQYLIVEG